MSGALASNPFRGRRASERTHNVCYMASGAASAPVVWRRGCAAVSGRLIASGVTGIPSRTVLPGHSLTGTVRDNRGEGLESSWCCVGVQCSQRGERGDRMRRAAPSAARCASSAGQPRRERGSEATNAGRGERKGACRRSRPLCALVGGAKRRAAEARQRCGSHRG